MDSPSETQPTASPIPPPVDPTQRGPFDPKTIFVGTSGIRAGWRLCIYICTRRRARLSCSSQFCCKSPDFETPFRSINAGDA